jgi:hypothetical protein
MVFTNTSLSTFSLVNGGQFVNSVSVIEKASIQKIIQLQRFFQNFINFKRLIIPYIVTNEITTSQL